MCFPIRCLKTSVWLMSFITLLIACVAMGYGGYYVRKDKDVWDASDNSYQYSLYALLLVSGIFMFINGLAGIIGGCRKSKCCLCCFNVGTIIMMLVFLLLGIVGASLYNNYVNKMQDDLDGGCQSTDSNLTWIHDLDSATSTANAFFCSASCQCVMGTENPDYQDMEIRNGIDNNGIDRVSLCPTIPDNVHKHEDALATFENTWQCSGICNKVHHYIFSDVRSGVPDKTCYQSFIDFAEKFGKPIYITSFCIFGYLLVNVILAFCLCCHPSKKEKGNMYQRMSYYD